MNTIENWITNNRVKRPEDFAEKFREIGFKIQNVLPPVFESYALIFHPYKIPKGKLTTEREELELNERKLIKNINNLIASEIGIPLKELPTERYDFEKVIRDTLTRKSAKQFDIEKTVKKLEKEALRLAVEPIQKFSGCTKEGNMPDERIYDLKEISWSELYKLYGLEFNYQAMWATLGKMVKSEDVYAGQETPEMGNIPKSVLEKIKRFLKKEDIRNVVVNSQKGVDSENIYIDSIDELDWVNLIASKNREWIFITPNDLCRTIIAGRREFIQKVITTEIFETTNELTENQRLDFYA